MSASSAVPVPPEPRPTPDLPAVLPVPDDGGRGSPDPLAGFGRAARVVLDRLTGSRTVATHRDGFDPELTESVTAPVLRRLHRDWFRVRTDHVDAVPATGPALLVSNHSGVLPWDAAMLAVTVHDEVPGGRWLRPLAADLVFAAPLVGRLARAGGARPASPAEGEALLRAGELVAVFPEGFRGTGKLYRDRYRLQRFGRGFVRLALRTGAPIVPCAVAGAEEAHPMLADLSGVARALGIPYLPVTPTWPLLGPLGLVPFPADWTIRFADPVPTDGYGADAADDEALVARLADAVRDTIAGMLDDLVPPPPPPSGPAGPDADTTDQPS